MKKQIKGIDFKGGRIFVEMEKVDIPIKAVGQNSVESIPDTELVSAVDEAIDALESLKTTVKGVINTIHESLEENAPHEWGVELNIAFKGKVSPVPVIVSGESEVAIKVHAKWVKSD
jgi:hypothetical protein